MTAGLSRVSANRLIVVPVRVMMVQISLQAPACAGTSMTVVTIHLFLPAVIQTRSTSAMVSISLMLELVTATFQPQVASGSIFHTSGIAVLVRWVIRLSDHVVTRLQAITLSDVSDVLNPMKISDMMERTIRMYAKV